MISELPIMASTLWAEVFGDVESRRVDRTFVVFVLTVRAWQCGRVALPSTPSAPLRISSDGEGKLGIMADGSLVEAAGPKTDN